ncbi:hypothetical protein ACGFY9_29535 [Streptomyces sp. NPDC048504]|uniref:hypothetical protein n=1 Tax=Streptomyces sp. NPDC048504 TaxID=3365559 RepID=UPI00370F9705
MTWTIDGSRVRPFLSAAERRDVTAMLWNAPPGRIFSEPEDGDVPPADGRPPTAGKRMKEFKDFKDGKDGKDGKEGKEVKEFKDTKDTKDFKDTKDTKDSKDSKDSKDFKDGKDSDGAMAAFGPAAFVRQPAEPRDPGSAGTDEGFEAPAESPAGGQDDAETLRGSRINRLLRRRGVVI